MRAPAPVGELEIEGEEAAAARRYYCGTIGVEFMHIPDRQKRAWVQERMGAEGPAQDRQRILQRILSAVPFEQVLQHRYPGTKRFSLEGLAALIPCLDRMLESSAA